MKQKNGKELEKLGFSSVEASIYVTLLEKGDLSGYQLGKHLGITRSSIYPALDSLYSKGVVSLIPGDVNIYAAQDPEQVIGRFKNEFNSYADTALGSLKSISRITAENRFLNIEGFDNILMKAKELINQAEKEIIIDTDYGLEIICNEIQSAISRNVRVIVYSWAEVNLAGLAVEYFSRQHQPGTCSDKRLIVISDMKSSLFSGSVSDSSIGFNGYYTENPLITKVGAEHIHLDIYMIRLMKKYGKDIIDAEIQFGSLLEKSMIGE